MKKEGMKDVDGLIAIIQQLVKGKEKNITWKENGGKQTTHS